MYDRNSKSQLILTVGITLTTVYALTCYADNSVRTNVLHCDYVQ